MKRVLHVITLLTVVVASDVVLAGLAAAQAPADAASNSGATTGYAFQITAPSASCGVALNKRTGRWVCPNLGGASGPMTPQNGKCLAWGCWDVDRDNTVSEFTGAGSYGYEGKRLGDVKFFFRITLSGYTSVSRVTFLSTGAVSELLMSGERLYWDKANPQCKEDSPSTVEVISLGDVPADTQKAWPGKGYVATQGTVHVASVIHGWNWDVADYPGTWYAYVKSVKFLKEDKGYRYESADHLCETPLAAGWSPE
jgi:hypothetical protein